MKTKKCSFERKKVDFHRKTTSTSFYSLRAKTFWNSDRHFLSTNLKFKKKIKTNILLKISKITQKRPKLVKIRLKMVFSSSRGGG